MLSGLRSNVKVQHGGRMLGLSSGTARQPDPGYMSVGGFDKGYTGNQPQGFQKESPAVLPLDDRHPRSHRPRGRGRAPTNAHGFSFSFSFYVRVARASSTNTYNDFFVLILSPIPMGQSGQQHLVRYAGQPRQRQQRLHRICGTAPAARRAGGWKVVPLRARYQQARRHGLRGDQFNDHGSTGWLFSKAPVNPSQENPCAGGHDSGDGVLDARPRWSTAGSGSPGPAPRFGARNRCPTPVGELTAAWY
jgi:hypothetical protein